MRETFPHEQPFGDDLDEAIARRYRLPLLISGTSDERVHNLARRIHAACCGDQHPFIQCEGRTVPSDPEQFASEWARLLRSATGGSMFLANIDAIARVVQDQLAESVYEHGQTHATGAARVIAGTTVPLFDRVLHGHFSATLFYRLNTIHLIVRD